MAAAEPHGLQQELSRGRGLAGPGGCSEPALPPSQRAVTIPGEQFQLPLLPLARGRKVGASSASPLLILIPPGPCISQSRTTTENRARAWFGTPGMELPVGMPRGWRQPWLGAGAPGPSLCPGQWLHPALGPLSPAEPKLQQNPHSLLPHLAPLPLPWHREGTRNLPQGPLTFQGHHGSFPQPWAPGLRASSTPSFP